MPRPRALAPTLPVALAALLTATACGGGDSGGSGSAGQRLRVVMAFPPAQGMSPYGDDAVTLSRLSVVEGLTRLGEDGDAKPALATGWQRDGDTASRCELSALICVTRSPGESDPMGHLA